jgi:RNA polymerase sigma factor (sigma-70 family)
MPPPSNPPPLFVTTRWSVVMTARDKGAPASREALETLCAGYWYPLYAYVRRLGNSSQDAEDLTQAFFARLLEKDWLDSVQRERGRFRTFLVVAIKRFMANEWDRSRAAKRGGGQVLVALGTECAEQRYLAEPSSSLPADHLYDRRWALTLLDQALARLRHEYDDGGNGEEFSRLKQFLTADRGAIPYAAIALETGGTEGAARVAVHRLRKRFREVFRATIADTVSRPEEVEVEMRYVVEVLSHV